MIAPAIANRLALFGGAALVGPTGVITGRATQRHRVALLALLSSTRRRQRSREQITALLWPDVEGANGRRLLSDSIYRVNRTLGGDVILTLGESLVLNHSRLASDVAD